MGKIFIVLLVALFDILLSLEPTNGDCIFLNDCADALKYIEKKRNDSKTISLLQNAHCGFGIQNGTQMPKVFCENIPAYPKLPYDCVHPSKCPIVSYLRKNSPNDPLVDHWLKYSRCGDHESDGYRILCNNVRRLYSHTNITMDDIVAEVFDEELHSRLSVSSDTGDSAETTEAPTPIPDSLEDKKELLAKPEECGSQMLNSRIRGGTKTHLEEFGWIALIKYKNTAGHVQHGCHGSLISKKYVVSAAHCFQTSYSDNLGNASSVVLGEYDTTTEKDCLFDGYCAAPIQEFSIDSVRIHENFDLRSVANDIALIRLNQPAMFSTFVRPICFPLDYVPLEKNEPLWISGWGNTENKTKSTVKLKAEIKHLTSEDCKNLIYFTTGDTQICAGSHDGSDSCKGDSGGPLMAKRASKMFLVGVVSFGIRCGARAAIYTNMTHYRDWILKNMEA